MKAGDLAEECDIRSIDLRMGAFSLVRLYIYNSVVAPGMDIALKYLVLLGKFPSSITILGGR